MIHRIIAACCCMFLSTLVFAQEAKPTDSKPKVNYEEHVLPIFRQHCLKCHNANEAKGGLAIDSYAALMEGGGSGEIVYDGDPEGSRLYQVMTHEDTPVMPPNQDPLEKAKLDVIKNWIAGGLLENSGSKAKKKKGPSLSFTAMSAGGKPSEIVMPESIWRVPITNASRAAAASAVGTSPWAPLAAIGGHKQVSLYNTDTGSLVGVLPYPVGVPQVIQFSLDGAYLLVAGGTHALQGNASVYNVKTGERMLTVGNELDSVFGADINDNMSRVAIGGPQKLIRIYDTATGEIAFEMKKHTDWVYCVDYSPDGVLVASGDRSGGLHVWEADTGRLYMDLIGHKAAVRGVSWRADSNVLISGSEDGTIKVWEMFGGKQLKSFNAHGGGVTNVMMAKNGQIVSSGKDGTVKLWQADGKLIKAFPSFGEAALEAALSHDGSKVIGGDWNGRTLMWNAADPKQVVELAANPPSLQTQQTTLTGKIAELEKLVAAGNSNVVNQEKSFAANQAAHAGLIKKLASAKAGLAAANTDKANATKSVAQLTQQKNAQDTQLKTLQTQVAALTNTINAATAKNKNASDLIVAVNSLAGVRSEVKSLTENTTKLASDLTNRELQLSVSEKVTSANKAKAEAGRKASQGVLATLNQQLAASQAKLKQLNTVLQQAKVTQKNATDAFNVSAAKANAAKAAVDKNAAQIAEKTKQVAAEKDASKKKALTEQLAVLQKQKAPLAASFAQIQKQHVQLTQAKTAGDNAANKIAAQLGQETQAQSQLTAKRNDTQNRINALAAQRDAAQKRIDEIAALKTALKKEQDSASAMKADSINKLTAASQRETQLVAQETKLRTLLGLAGAPIEKVTALAAAQKAVVDAESPKLASLRTQAQAASAKAAELTKQLNAHNAALAKANQQIKQFTAAVPATEKQIADSQKKVSASSSAVAQAKAAAGDTAAKLANAKSTLASLSEELVAFQSYHTKLAQQISAAQSEAQLKAQAAAAEAGKLKKTDESLAAHATKLKGLNDTLAKLQAQIAEAQKLHAAEQASMQAIQAKVEELNKASAAASEVVEEKKQQAEFFKSVYGG